MMYKIFWRLYAGGVALLFFNACSMFKKKSLYVAPEYTLYSNKVVQGKHKAVATSATKIKSDYASPASATFSRLIKFKFSINEKDNELAPGDDHWVSIQNEHISPVAVFGQLPDPLPSAPATYLPVNYQYTFRADMRPVLKQFEEKGYYEAYDGSRITKADFKGFYIAGAAAPLSWDFVNLGNKGLKMEDADGDGIYTITLVFNPHQKGHAKKRRWQLQKDITSKPSYESGQPIVDALYNLSLEEALTNIEADSTFRTGTEWGGVWTRDISYSIWLAFAYHQPDIAKISLLRKVKRKRIIQDTGSGGSWPISSDRVVWVLAAWELYKVTGDKDWLSLAFEIVKNSLEDDDKVLFDPATGLFKGESSFLDWREQTYPYWMNNADIFQSLNLGTNVLHYQAWSIAVDMAKALGQSPTYFEKRAAMLKRGIRKHLWLEDRGYFSQYLYGRTERIPSPRMEALGESLSILFGVADSTKARQIVERTPLTPFGITCIYPQIPGIPPYHNNAIWPFVQAYWNLAAAKVGNEKALSHGLASLYRAAALFLTNYENMVATTGDFKGTEINSSRMLWSMAGNIAMVHRVFMGMQFEEHGIRFEPVIPAAYGGKKTLSNFRYKNMNLTIKVSGTGKLKSFKLDGQPITVPFLSDALTGEHTIEIKLDNRPLPGQKIHLVENTFSLPAPRVELNDNALSWEKINGAVDYRVYRNGILMMSVKDNSFQLIPQETGEYAVAAVDNRGFISLISEPILYYPEKFQTIVEIEDSLSPAAQPFTQYTGSGFVEISNELNKDIEFDIDIPQAGMHLIDFRYSNGSGPWNTDNKCATRSLQVNNKYAGAVVFPQRGTEEWSNWGYSNSYAVQMQKGKNRIRLSLQNWNINMNESVNRAMIDHVRVIAK